MGVRIKDSIYPCLKPFLHDSFFIGNPDEESVIAFAFFAPLRFSFVFLNHPFLSRRQVRKGFLTYHLNS